MKQSTTSLFHVGLSCCIKLACNTFPLSRETSPLKTGGPESVRLLMVMFGRSLINLGAWSLWSYHNGVFGFGRWRDEAMGSFRSQGHRLFDWPTAWYWLVYSSLEVVFGCLSCNKGATLIFTGWVWVCGCLQGECLCDSLFFWALLSFFFLI